ncbi:hypothetical protein BDV27DRAFT_128597 [Aspergillus caelatus]|uniref:DUF1754-domain-containing protein n=2 Tax=Aspergillus subgen. Circumdati TaxID=2720871 RepID=A0A5N7A6Y2_9EURO|nr:uncharacterized protein BDV27DRAFT_128597 [Aspergillus caelatus]KAE8364300.1 hypothetical protein BDV27DRAFT_128597 [Aspergillus caelatus]KAE8413704.1 hypothetical protein BDV36DRAFT_299672 [Aspergillus pseudocaelatus]
MPADEYSVGGGGKLKLKGSKVSDGRIEKKKKKAKKSNPETSSKKESEDAPPPASTSQAADEKESSTSLPQPDESDVGVGVVAAGKTEAERKHEEMRKKRLQERLKREGVKTHKERVEELNKYLSRLSEHHDMPKIGPG